MRLPLLLLACGLYGLGALAAPPGAGAAADRVRDLARPWVMPVLWARAEAAQRAGTMAEAVTQGRLLLRLWPDWAEGHVLFASRLAFEASLAERDPGLALDRLQAGLALLDEALAACRREPAEILVAMASFAEIRARQDPALARAFAARLGVSAEAYADACLARAEAVEPRVTVAERRAYLAARLIGAWLRAGAVGEARATLALADQRLAGVRDQENAAAWRAALRRLDASLAGRSQETLSDLARDPHLAEILAPVLAAPR
ncbi:MAG: hypothetical protein IT458_12900 [Planctomycetes bacterium]|nr:hypothetical protein [Planctomycetota bacterium]